jgi:membrane protease YdiL (CAAX protease family)
MPNHSQRRRALVAYFVLTYLISWAIELPLALSYQRVIHIRVPFALHYLASFGPLLAAVIVTLAQDGWVGVRGLFSGPGRRRVERVYLLFAVVAPVVLFALVVAVSGIVQGAWPDLRSLGQPDYLPEIGILPTLGLWLLTFGLGEEVGWRGFALPRLQVERPALSASLLLGALWACWHLPALFYRDTYIAMGLLVIPMLLTVAAVGSVVYTWLYNGTGGSLLLLVVFHGLFDFFSVWPAGVIGAGPVMTVCMVFWAVRVFKLYGPGTLCPGDKVAV